MKLIFNLCSANIVSLPRNEFEMEHIEHRIAGMEMDEAIGGVLNAEGALIANDLDQPVVEEPQ